MGESGGGKVNLQKELSREIIPRLPVDAPPDLLRYCRDLNVYLERIKSVFTTQNLQATLPQSLASVVLPSVIGSWPSPNEYVLSRGVWTGTNMVSSGRWLSARFVALQAGTYVAEMTYFIGYNNMVIAHRIGSALSGVYSFVQGAALTKLVTWNTGSLLAMGTFSAPATDSLMAVCQSTPFVITQPSLVIAEDLSTGGTGTNGGIGIEDFHIRRIS